MPLLWQKRPRRSKSGTSGVPSRAFWWSPYAQQRWRKTEQLVISLLSAVPGALKCSVITCSLQNWAILLRNGRVPLVKFPNYFTLSPGGCSGAGMEDSMELQLRWSGQQGRVPECPLGSGCGGEEAETAVRQWRCCKHEVEAEAEQNTGEQRWLRRWEGRRCTGPLC